MSEDSESYSTDEVEREAEQEADAAEVDELITVLGSIIEGQQ